MLVMSKFKSIFSTCPFKIVEFILNFDQVFEETLRLYPPAASVVKRAPAGLVLGGYSIPEGTAISVSYTATPSLSLSLWR